MSTHDAVARPPQPRPQRNVQTGVAGLSDSTSRSIVMLFGLTMFLSATLLFDIQPMYAKMLLPLVGGVPAVWNTVVVFFQVALIGGYLLAHVQQSLVPLKAQTIAHVALAALAITLLPFRTLVANDSAIEHPVPFALLALLIGAGLPFLVISATAPLLQSWFARLGHARSHDPYFFYSASNAGSLLGLAAYPLLLEPLFGVRLQSQIWAAGYCALVLCLATCGYVTWRFGTAGDLHLQQNEVTPTSADPPSWRRRLGWTALAFVPASLSLAMTTHITNEVAPIPLLWTLPLGVYLLTFVIAFSRRPVLTPKQVARALPYPILLLALLLRFDPLPASMLDLGLNLIALFLIALTCHGALSASRPAARYLTGFYLVLATGGALGGLFNALVAPYVFNTVAEYPLTLVLACFILPTLGVVAGSKRERFFDVAAPVLLYAAMLLLYGITVRTGGIELGMRIAFPLATVACFSFLRRRIRFALGIAAIFLAGTVLPSWLGDRIYAHRNFFGTKLVVDRPPHLHEFIHGGTVHGIENTEPALRDVPLAYYSKDGPLSSIFAALHSRHGRMKKVGIVGLGVGTIACYRLPGEQWTFFEIDPQVVSLAQDSKFFWYLSSCAPDANIVVGDGRVELAKLAPNAYDLLVLDAYSSDQPPLHLLTSEAFRVFTNRVVPGGLIAFHTSNRYFNLVPSVGKLAASVGWKAWLNNDVNLSLRQASLGEAASQWVVVARDPAEVGTLASDHRWHLLIPDTRLRTWTDDYSSLLLVMHT